MIDRALRSEWVFVVLLIVLAWGLRLCCLEEVPPGWRDDELINIHALSGKLLEGHFPLYFTGASGHEPLYHYLHAGVQFALGHNSLSRHLLSAISGTLAVALTYALTRDLLGTAAARIASLGLAISFWSLMYSRIALRHISLLPWALAAFRLLPIAPSPAGESERWGLMRWTVVGLLLAASIYTYPAARLLPGLLILFAVYLALFHGDRFQRYWRGLLTALLVALILVIPLGVAIGRGSTSGAEQGIGADARLSELAGPFRALRDGNPRPAIENTLRTLGMFHAGGDPEWLYNIRGRPLFNWLGGALLWSGVLLCILRWQEPQSAFLLLWLGVGLLPAFLSTPAASLSHTILAQPVAYILPALSLSELRVWISSRDDPVLIRRLSPLTGRTGPFLAFGLAVVFLITNAVRDFRDYFYVWPQKEMVRVLYRADYREVADYLNDQPDVTDVAVGSALLGPWDRLALRADVQRDDLSIRLFNPERALVWTDDESTSTVLLTTWPTATRPIQTFLQDGRGHSKSFGHGVQAYRLAGLRGGDEGPLAQFSNGLSLMEGHWLQPAKPGQEALLLTSWIVADRIALPPMSVVANPPPPGVYAGPRLKVFAHLVGDDGTTVEIDDGLWVDPVTLEPGDRFVQLHRFDVPSTAVVTSPRVELGLYDPKTGERWDVRRPMSDSSRDYVIIR